MSEEIQKEPIEHKPEYLIIKLSTGDEVLGPTDFLTHEGEVAIRIYDPLKIVLKYTEEGTARVLERYNPHARENWSVIMMPHVVNVSPLSDLMTEYYAASLEHCRKVNDKADADNIRSVTKVLGKMNLSSLQDMELITTEAGKAKSKLSLAEVAPGTATRH